MIRLTKDLAIAQSQIVAMERQDGYASLPDKTGGYIYLANNSHGFWAQGEAFEKLWVEMVGEADWMVQEEGKLVCEDMKVQDRLDRKEAARIQKLFEKHGDGGGGHDQ